MKSFLIREDIMFKYIIGMILFFSPLCAKIEINIEEFLPKEKKGTVVLMTGCSRGIGFVTARTLIEKGYTVYATMRNIQNARYLEDSTTEFPGTLFVRYLDVTKEESIQNVIDEILKNEGHLDILVNNAGWGLKGTAEGVTIDQAQKVFDTNFFGMLRLIQAALPIMRSQSYGRIINISSLAAIAPLPGWDIYASSKQAVEALSEAMAPSLKAWNIGISIVEPGVIQGERATALEERFLGKNNPYSGILEASKKWIEAEGGPPQPAEEVADLIYSIIKSESPKFRYQTNITGKRLASEKLRYPMQTVLDLNDYVSIE